MTFGRPKPWKKRPDLIAKAMGMSDGDKGPDRSSAFLVRIRQQGCLCCDPDTQGTPTRAHHPRGLFPRTMGVRISDYLCVPLCDWHHTDGAEALHKTGDEQAWWAARRVSPLAFIERFSKEGRAVLAEMMKPTDGAPANPPTDRELK